MGKLPALKYFIFLSIGIIGGMIIKISVIMSVIILGLILIALFLLKAKSNAWIFILCIIACGSLRVSMYDDHFNNKHDMPEGRGELELIIQKQKTNPFYIDSYIVSSCIQGRRIKGTLYAKTGMPVLIPGRSYHISDVEWAPISGERNPYVFNYLNYAKIHDISHRFSIRKNAIIEENSVNNPLVNIAHLIRTDISVRYLCVLGIEKGSLVNGLLLGLKSEIPSCIADLFRQLGVSHLLAVSGLHVGLIMLILYQILLTMNIPRIPRTLCVGIFLLFYCFLTGGSPSVIRSSLMTVMLMFAPVFNRKYQALNAVAASAVFLLLVNPFYIRDLGFQFSYAAVFGILLAYPIIRKKFKKVDNKLINYVLDMLAVSLSAALFTTPVALYYFNTLQLASMLLNIIVIPLTFCVMICAILCLPGLYFQGFMSNIFLSALDLSLDVFRAVLRLASRSELWTLHISSYWKPLAFAFIIICIVLICFKGRYKKIMGVSACCLICGVWFQIGSRSELIQPKLKKGQVLMYRHGREALLVNTGSTYYNYNDYERNILPVFDHWGINKVTIVITDWTKQNYANLGNILRRYPGSNIIAPSHAEFNEIKTMDIVSDTSMMLAGNNVEIISENKMLSLVFNIKQNIINYHMDSLFVNGKESEAEQLVMRGHKLIRRE